MRARGRNTARRLACFLDAVGVSPVLTGKGYRKDCQALSAQYTALPKMTRREARRRGRRIIREIGLEAAAKNLFPAMPLSTPPRPQKDYALKLASLLSQSPGRCPSCRSWGHSKRSWPSRDVAEKFRPFSGDMSLVVYECPVYRGTYHLGHRAVNSDGKQPQNCC